MPHTPPLPSHPPSQLQAVGHTDPMSPGLLFNSQHSFGASSNNAGIGCMVVAAGDGREGGCWRGKRFFLYEEGPFQVTPSGCMAPSRCEARRAQSRGLPASQAAAGRLAWLVEHSFHLVERPFPSLVLLLVPQAPTLHMAHAWHVSSLVPCMPATPALPWGTSLGLHWLNRGGSYAGLAVPGLVWWLRQGRWLAAPPPASMALPRPAAGHPQPARPQPATQPCRATRGNSGWHATHVLRSTACWPHAFSGGGLPPVAPMMMSTAWVHNQQDVQTSRLRLTSETHKPLAGPSHTTIMFFKRGVKLWQILGSCCCSCCIC